MPLTLSSNKLLPHRGEGVDEGACFEAGAAVGLVRGDVVSVPGAEDGGLVSDVHFEPAACDEGRLAVGMRVFGADGAGFEMDFHHHEPVVVAQNLPGDAGFGMGPG